MHLNKIFALDKGHFPPELLGGIFPFGWLEKNNLVVVRPVTNLSVFMELIFSNFRASINILKHSFFDTVLILMPVKFH